MRTMKKIDLFTLAYIECALWSSTDDNDEPMDTHYNYSDIDPDTLNNMIQDCADFQRDNASLLEGLDDKQCGHDFWLTRNSHGCGFWSRSLGDIGNKLTEQSHLVGGVDLYVGDDGKIYSV